MKKSPLFSSFELNRVGGRGTRSSDSGVGRTGFYFLLFTFHSGFWMILDLSGFLGGYIGIRRRRMRKERILISILISISGMGMSVRLFVCLFVWLSRMGWKWVSWPWFHPNFGSLRFVCLDCNWDLDWGITIIIIIYDYECSTIITVYRHYNRYYYWLIDWLI